MKITKRQLRRMIREEVETLEYDMLQDTTDELLDADHPEDVVPQRDSWAGGQNVHNQVDHGEASGGGPNTRGQEVMRVTESQLRRIIKEVMEPMTPGYVYNSLMARQEFGPNKGMTRMDMIRGALDDMNPGPAAGYVMDALWIDDPSLEAENELEDLLMDTDSEDDLVVTVADWGTRHFRTRMAR